MIGWVNNPKKEMDSRRHAAARETVSDEPDGYRVLTEGQAKILYKEEKLQADENNMIKTSKGKRVATDQNEVRGTVFYNPVQEFNRDISILTIREFSKVKQAEVEAKKKEFQGLNILEALAATGLRSVRYLKEIENIKTLVANDIDPTATELMQKNFDYNSIEKEKYQIYTADAIDLMNSMRKDKRHFEVVDLDPYGTAVPFLESAIQAIADGGLLAVTCTDMAVLCARTPHVCFYKYGGAPLSKPYCHEMALRIVLRMISEIANRQQKYIEPLISLTVDFYVRLFIRVKEGAKPCHESIVKYSNVFQCMDCESHYFHQMGNHFLQELTTDDQGKKVSKKKRKFGEPQMEVEEEKKGESTKISDKYSLPQFKVPQKCSVCDGAFIMGGPIWNREIHNVEFAKSLLESARLNSEGKNGHKLKTTPRIQAILAAIIDESVLAMTPLSYELSHIASTFKVSNPRNNQLIAAFNSLGYILRQTYYEPKLFKTNAPPEIVYDIFKAWRAQTNEGKGEGALKNIQENSLIWRILQKEATVKPNFNEEQVQQLVKLQKTKKYLPIPEPNWGPKGRAMTAKK